MTTATAVLARVDCQNVLALHGDAKRAPYHNPNGCKREKETIMIDFCWRFLLLLLPPAPAT
jgi:hypothetical protein